MLVGDATELVSREKAERVEGVGIPPTKELLQKLLDNQIPVYVWKGLRRPPRGDRRRPGVAERELAHAT